MKLEGIWTALITPFADDGFVDVPALRALVEGQVAAGIHGLVACGTTGEPPTLDAEEYALVVRTILDTVHGRIPVIAGTGANSTAKTVALTRQARALGVDGALVVTPYYNKPQQDGMVEHFRVVAAEGGLPVVLYNVPGRTGVNLLPKTVARLSVLPGIVGVKEASGGVGPVRDIVATTGPSFAVMSGDDGLALPSWAVGACGVVSVASNVAPGRMVALWDAWTAGRVAEAAAIDRTLNGLYQALFLESSPAPCKAAAAMLGLCRDVVRLPLVPAAPGTRDALRDALSQAGVL